MKNNFDWIAPVYDQLKFIVFGRTLERATSEILESVKPSDTVLIVGGGTGKVLNYLTHVTCIDYVEKSKNMIRKAKRRNQKGIHFIHCDFLEWETAKKYDFILLPFFLDVFDEANLIKVVKKVKTLSKPTSLIQVTDFQKSNSFVKSFLIKLMYFFFRHVSSLEGSKILQLHEVMVNERFKVKQTYFYSDKMIFTRIYHVRETL
jgi:ubiquinone/menaquinone biosynthesis C-methylase UbiE